MVKRIDSNAQRLKRHKRVRGKISGTPERPRLAVYRSNAHISAQIIDDVNGVTLVSANTYEKNFEGIGSNKEAARKVGNTLAQRALEKGISAVVFDRNFFFHEHCQSISTVPSSASSSALMGSIITSSEIMAASSTSTQKANSYTLPSRRR